MIQIGQKTELDTLLLNLFQVRGQPRLRMKTCMMQGMALVLGGYTSVKAAADLLFFPVCDLHNLTSLSLLLVVLIADI